MQIVLFCKMIGDYYRYLAEFSPDVSAKQQAENYYNQAWKLAQTSLDETHPTRLGMQKNIFVFLCIFFV